MLDPATARYLDLGAKLPDQDQLDDFARFLTGRPEATTEDVVVTYGTPAAMAELAAKAQLGHAELERRRARRKAQRASRKRNR